MNNADNSERQQRLMDLFRRALAADEAQRSAPLDDAPADPELRREIARLLESDSTVRDPLTDARTLTDMAGIASASGDSIGRYHLLQRIGEGGMGEVWMAEQKEPVRRRVALKLIKAGMNSREVIRRFESERQALALMDHPSIAKVFDAGSTSTGAPYFVMEYVAGVAINAYCDNHRLGTRERLELFMLVCEGVQHAHQKAVIHRDLKPSNILVVEVDGRPVPKIIDFGIAKAIAQKLTAETLFTRMGAIIGTPEYMSPEQAKSSGEDVDTRTDVYSLGVILYELLAGAPPIELRGIAFDEFQRRLRELEPSKPSTRIRTRDHATSMELARRRKTEPTALTKQIRGDLDTIALKALEKERSRRYASPADLAADLGRYLKNQPVLAVPPSAIYLARKFARRYRVALATVSAFVLVLIAATIVTTGESIRATKAAASAQAVSDFLQNDLLAQASVDKQSGKNVKPDPDLKVRTALDRAAARIGGKFNRQPEVEAAIRDSIGKAYYGLGQYPDAAKQMERVLELRLRLLGPENTNTLEAMNDLAAATYNAGDYQRMEAILDRALPIQRRIFGPNHPGTLSMMNNLAFCYQIQGKYAQVGALHAQILEVRKRTLGPEDAATLRSMDNLAFAYYFQGKYADAEALLMQTEAIQRRVSGPDNSSTLAYLHHVAMAQALQGKYASAEDLYGKVLEAKTRTMGPDHPDTISVYWSLADMYQRQGDYSRAEENARKAFDGRRRLLGPRHPDTVMSEDDLALAYQSEGKYPASEPLAREAQGVDTRIPWQRFRSESLLGASLAGQKKYAEAEPLLVEAYGGMLKLKDTISVPDRYHLDRAHDWLVQLYRSWGKPEKLAVLDAK